MNKVKYYLLRNHGTTNYEWLAIVKSGKLFREYNLIAKADTTKDISLGYKNNYLENTKLRYECKEITKEEMFLRLL